jgi:hypothetical protein
VVIESHEEDGLWGGLGSAVGRNRDYPEYLDDGVSCVIAFMIAPLWVGDEERERDERESITLYRLVVFGANEVEYVEGYHGYPDQNHL